MAVNKVLATDNARQAAARIHALLSGTITADIKQLQTIGTRLAQPEVWEGPSAIHFRQIYWPPASRALQTVVHDLEALARQMEAVVLAILEAGGGGGGAPGHLLPPGTPVNPHPIFGRVPVYDPPPGPRSVIRPQ